MEIPAINSLIEFFTEDASDSKINSVKDNEIPAVERILYFSRENDWFVTIDVFSKNSLPVFRSRAELTIALESGRAQVLENDPFSYLIAVEKDIPENHRAIRDKAYETIAEIVESDGLKQFVNKERGKIINSVSKKSGCIKKTIYNRLRRYWKGGMRKNALLPDFKNCGTNNEWRTKNHKKIGRPSLLSKRTGETRGVIITPLIKRKFEKGVRKYYLREDKPNFRWAYRRMINDFFHNGFEIVDGIAVPVIPPAQTLPSLDQFYYWYQNEYRNIKRENRARFGKLEAEMNHRALLGDSTAMASGPGSVYQADATIGDIYLVSELDRTRIIGRPVIYFIIDMFSRYIAGIAVTLEGPSWLGAMLALDNVVCDKGAFCAEHGRTIKPEDWNVRSLPEILLGDRGELEGKGADPLVDNLGVRVQNTKPYRGDFKAIVERAFGKANEKFIHFLPGAVEYDGNRRGKPDYRLDATYTLKEFRSLLIEYVLDYNSSNYLSWYKPDKHQIADKVDLCPQELWDWGIKNRSGHLRYIDQKIVRLNLLPRKQVSVTKHGIHFEHGLFYTCELAEREGWFERARNRGSWKIEVAYDPRSLTNIYLPLKNGREITTCYLTPAAQTYKSCSIYDIEDYFHSKTERREENKTRELQSDAGLYARMEKITSQAKEKTEAARRAAGKQSASSQISGIRENRKNEREMERRAGAFDLTGPDEKKPETAMNRNTKNEEEKDTYVPAPNRIEQIRKLLGNK